MSKKGSHRQNNRSPQTKRRVWIGVGIGLVVVVIAFIAVQLLKDDHKSSTDSSGLPLEVSDQAASTLRDQGAFILDVREPDEWADFHMPGSTLIPLGELPNRLSEVPKDQKIVVVCRSGNRSAQGRDILLAAGYPQVTSLAGGLTQWRDQGFPTVTGP